jgi:DNA relaxase NicK
MFKIDTLHVTFQSIDRDVDIQVNDLHDLCSVMPENGLRPFASNVFDSRMYIEPCKPLHGYAYGYAIVYKDFIEESNTFKTLRAGSIFYGGNNNRPFLQFNGVGCSHLNFVKLHEVLKTMNKVRVTRCDIAVDDLDGLHGDILTVVEAYKSGLFKRGGNQPSVSQVGDWLTDNSPKGRTLYIGSRKGSAMMRIYEKGKELGLSTSPWIRYELELKSVDYILPIHIILDPSSYFLSLNEFNKKFTSSFVNSKLSKKTKLVDQLEDYMLWNHRVKYAKMQAGAVLLEHLIKHHGDLGSLVTFAKSSKLSIDNT